MKRIYDKSSDQSPYLAAAYFSTLHVGIFANGNPDTAAWNGISTPVLGLLYGGSTQILAQVAEVVVVGTVAFASAFAFFKILHAQKLLRVSREVELEGLDMPEMGVLG